MAITSRSENRSSGIVDLELVISSVKSNDRSGLRLSINQSFILTRYVEVLENSFKIRTCINKIYNNYSYVMILFNEHKKLSNMNIKYKKLRATKKTIN